MKRSVILLSLVLFVCLLTGCGNKVDKPTFIVAMDQNVSAVQMIDAEAVLLVNELLWIMPFVEDTASYRAKVASYQERFDKIVVAAKKIPVPKDKDAREVYAMYIDIIEAKNEAYDAALDWILDTNVKKYVEDMLTLEGEIDPRWEAFLSAWHAYKAS